MYSLRLCGDDGRKIWRCEFDVLTQIGEREEMWRESSIKWFGI